MDNCSASWLKKCSNLKPKASPEVFCRKLQDWRCVSCLDRYTCANVVNKADNIRLCTKFLIIQMMSSKTLNNGTLRIAASYARITDRIIENGPNLGMPYTEAMGEGLFEIRAKGVEGIGRAFF